METLEKDVDGFDYFLEHGKIEIMIQLIAETDPKNKSFGNMVTTLLAIANKFPQKVEIISEAYIFL